MNVISTQQFLDKDILHKIFSATRTLMRADIEHSLAPTLKGKVLASLFYEPSTRTRFSFESAMLKLGGQVISTENAAQFSSATKGESLQDTIRIVSAYCDVIVLRHFEQGSATLATEVSQKPIINAGDGVGEHPTQALLDLFTIEQEIGALDGRNILLVGDLLHGRTIHSLLYLLCLFKVKLFLVSPPTLRLPKKYQQYLRDHNIFFQEHTELESLLPNADVIYMTRVQKERFQSLDEYESLKDHYVLDKKSLALMHKKCIIMHPLPRLAEIHSDVDSDLRAAYFRQARNGLYIRMALLEMIFSKKSMPPQKSSNIL